MGVKRLSIIIVHYNKPDYLERCLESIKGCGLPPYTEIIVVDNGSRNSEELRYLCSKNNGKVKLLLNPSNYGLARAANQALETASGDYLLHLNPDILVNNGSIYELARFLDGNPSAGIAFPKLLNPDGSLQLSCRTHYDLLTILLRRIPLGETHNSYRVRNHLMADWDHEQTREIDWALGAAFMVRREALTKGRLFDDRYFLYMEDVDLCLTLRQCGWEIYYVPSAVMTHHHLRASRTKTWSRANWEHAKSFVRFSFKHGPFNGRTQKINRQQRFYDD